MPLRAPFPYYGGKYHKLKWLLPLLPQTKYYCEPFGGSGVVLLNRKPSEVETYNDIDGQLVNFFRVLRDHPDELIMLLSLTPYSRWEYAASLANYQDVAASVELARRFYVVARSTFGGGGKRATAGNWSHAITDSNRGMSNSVSKWLSAIDGVLPLIVDRLRRVQIECNDALKVIGCYDNIDALFYCDPPYPISSRAGGYAYSYECGNEYHIQLADKLNGIKGLAAVSGYHCELLDYLYGDWAIHEFPTVRGAQPGAKVRTIEVLWANYDLN